MPTFCFKCCIPGDIYESKLALWYSLGMQGCEENTVSSGVNVKVYFDSEDAIQSAINDCKTVCSSQILTYSEIQKQDWNAKWRESMQPAKLAPGYWVSPLWLPPNMAANDIWIKIEPKMAFGTGHHETTSLAAEALIDNKNFLQNKVIVDIGSGSGVLCFVADTLGATRSIGIEIDIDCQENLVENYQLNTPSARIDFIIGTTNAIKSSFLPDIIVMNMILTESAPLLAKASESLCTGSLLILSGILVDEYTKTIELAASVSCTLKNETQENEWWCGVFEKA